MKDLHPNHELDSICACAYTLLIAAGSARAECPASSVVSWQQFAAFSLSLLLRESVELEKYRGSEPEVTIWCPMCYLAVLTARLAALLCIIFSVRLYKTAADSRKYKS